MRTTIRSQEVDSSVSRTSDERLSLGYRVTQTKHSVERRSKDLKLGCLHQKVVFIKVNFNETGT